MRTNKIGNLAGRYFVAITMPSYDKFFYGALFFLFGVFLKSLGLSFGIIVITIAVIVFFNILRFNLQGRLNLPALSILAIFIPVGALYYTWDDLRFRSAEIPFGAEVTFTGVVSEEPRERITYDDLVLSLDPPRNGKIILRLQPFSGFRYGDRLRVTGKIEEPFADWYAKYLAKERISGVLAFPKKEVALESGGNIKAIKSALFKIKNYTTGVYERTLPPKEAAFITAMTMGDRTKMTNEFREAMSQSGTTHLTALSGLHISVILGAAVLVMSQFLHRRWIFPLAVLFLLGYAVMTGGSPSVVRAGTMGGLFIFAGFLGRSYDFRNAIVFAALAMVLFNPKLLMFDLAFQLSFLALLGIVYLRPAIMKFLRIPETPGFMRLKDYFFVTLSAQLAVIPIMVLNFNVFSISSFVANTLILPVIPVAIVLGFLASIASLVSGYLASAVALLNLVLLKFAAGVIEFFGLLGWTVSPKVGWATFAVYYLLLIAFMIKYHPRGTEYDYFRVETAKPSN